MGYFTTAGSLNLLMLESFFVANVKTFAKGWFLKKTLFVQINGSSLKIPCGTAIKVGWWYDFYLDVEYLQTFIVEYEVDEYNPVLNFTVE